MIFVEVKGQSENRNKEDWNLDQRIKAQKESKVKPNMRKRQKEGFKAEERGFEDQIWSVQIILAVSFCFNV